VYLVTFTLKNTGINEIMVPGTSLGHLFIEKNPSGITGLYAIPEGLVLLVANTGCYIKAIIRRIDQTQVPNMPPLIQFSDAPDNQSLCK
jgi:hypothetical protein